MEKAEMESINKETVDERVGYWMTKTTLGTKVYFGRHDEVEEFVVLSKIVSIKPFLTPVNPLHVDRPAINKLIQKTLELEDAKKEFYEAAGI